MLDQISGERRGFLRRVNLSWAARRYQSAFGMPLLSRRAASVGIKARSRSLRKRPESPADIQPALISELQAL